MNQRLATGHRSGGLGLSARKYRVSYASIRARALATILAGPCLFAACGDAFDDVSLRRGGASSGADAGGEVATDPAAAAKCETRAYIGLGKEELHAQRLTLPVGSDRARIKPFSALTTEYERVLGAAPKSLTGAGPTFGVAPERWYSEPVASSVSLQTAYTIAFDGCLTLTQSAAEFAAAPDGASAAVQCSAFAKRFWSKTPTPSEIDACVDVAVNGAKSEPVPRRKWAYACASVLSAAGFITY